MSESALRVQPLAKGATRIAARIAVALGVTIGFACQAGAPQEQASNQRVPIVYDTDGRRDVYDHPNESFRALAREKVAIHVRRSLIDTSNPSELRFDVGTLGESKNLCSGERFEDQPKLGTCSATLIGPRLLLTAGHCMDERSDCEEYAWLFGFHYESEDTLAPLTRDDLYGCERVVAYRDYDGVDLAIVELERDVVGRTPALVRDEDTALETGLPLTLIGFPNGIAAKIDSGGSVTAPRADRLTNFKASIDAFDGNSGSGVFSHDGVLVGVLTAGETDYVERGSCNVVNVIDEELGEGETVAYVARALDMLCASSAPDPALCVSRDAPLSPGQECETATILPFESGSYEADLDGYGLFAEGTCGGRLGPDRAFILEADEDAEVTLEVSGFDSVLYVREGCAGRELDCNDDIDREGRDYGSRVSFNAEAGERYAIFVDAYDSDIDPATLSVEIEAASTPLPADGGPSDGDGGTDTGTSDADDSGLSDSGTDSGDMDAGMLDASEWDGGELDESNPGSGCSVSSAQSTSPLVMIIAGMLLVTRRRETRS